MNGNGDKSGGRKEGGIRQGLGFGPPLFLVGGGLSERTSSVAFLLKAAETLRPAPCVCRGTLAFLGGLTGSTEAGPDLDRPLPATTALEDEAAGRLAEADFFGRTGELDTSPERVLVRARDPDATGFLGLGSSSESCSESSITIGSSSPLYSEPSSSSGSSALSSSDASDFGAKGRAREAWTRELGWAPLPARAAGALDAAAVEVEAAGGTGAWCREGGGGPGLRGTGLAGREGPGWAEARAGTRPPVGSCDRATGFAWGCPATGAGAGAGGGGGVG